MANPQQGAPSSEGKARVKRPTCAKRQLQNEKKRFRNKSVRSEVKTETKSFFKIVDGKDQKLANTTLNDMYSLVDKAVKKGVLKKNKGSRIKARMAQALVAKAA